MEMERKGVECCWRGSTPAAEGLFALRACISEGVLYMNCLYRSHFQHDRLIPSLWQARLRIRLFESKSVLTDREAT
jgi:hypothetical protein